MEFAESPWFLPLAGLLAGLVMGYAARRTHFCTLSALERHWYAADSTGLSSWILAAAVALMATQAMIHGGVADISRSFYLSPLFGVTGAVIGGLAFGFGMALVGTCGFGALVRAGGGSLRSVVVLLVLGLSALAAQKGLIAQLRVEIVDNLAIDLAPVKSQSLGDIASHFAGADLSIAVAVAVATLMLAWAFRDAAFRRSRGRILTGIVLGLAVAFGWWATSTAAHHAFQPVQIEAASFVVPVGDTIMHFATFTGVVPDYGVGLMIGVVLGAALCAWWADDMRWEACDDARELSRHMAGGFLMGTGGVFAMGCTIGQGVSAVSTLALSAPVVMISIALGARMGLAWMLEGSIAAAFRRTGHDPAE
ncbi:mmebrane protein [Zhengella mangrovi]|uniref:Mmebrane protein n=1 Tax=Zhengella mangrovi TaxID=1982044 RepID=A0A2G1QL37_9HYPH|nr:YeeE/YedE family protein [Zhengella mangrovi]PHP66184.1 mmebrane protein [Zhengella mangrovi]